MSPEGSDAVTLTDELHALDLAWSPSGDHLAVATLQVDYPAPIASDIYVIGADGSGLTNLTEDATQETNVSWSPDGQWLLFVTQGTSKQTDATPATAIVVMRADGTERRSLVEQVDGTANPFWYPNPVWSPDGGQIRFLRDQAAYTVDVDGAAETRLTDVDQLELQTAHWSPDRTRLAFATFDIDGSITLVNVETGERTTVSYPSSGNEFSAWLPDSRHIAFVAQQQQAEVRELIVIDIESGDAVSVLQVSPDVYLGPLIWSPDGTRIAFLSLDLADWR